MYFVRIIDENGLLIGDGWVDELTEYTIDITCPESFHHPKWDGEKWIEGGEALPPVEQEPTETERLEALELVVLDMLMLNKLGGGI